MILMFIVSNGDELIGTVADEEVNTKEFYNIEEPMYVMDSANGMRLRKTLLLSADSVLTIPAKHIISYYKPSEVMELYYHRAVEYHQRFTQEDINNQITYAITELENTIKEEEARASKLKDVVAKIMGERTVH